MRQSRWALIGLVAGLVCQVPRHCAGDEFESWGQIGAVAAMNELWEVHLEETLKVREGFGEFYKHNTNVALGYSGLAQGLDVSLGFRRLYEKDSDGQWDTENRPHVNVKIKTGIRDIQVSSRSRFEYRLLNDQEDYWRYRNLIQVKLPSLGTDWGLYPYLAAEPHFNMERGEFQKNRSYFGVAADITKTISGTLYYLLERNKSDGHWHSQNVVGTSLVFHLK